MRIAVIGGTGVVGRYTVEALRRERHDTVVIARACGADITTGEGLDHALLGVDVVIDVANIQAADAETTRNLFAAATRNVLSAEQRAGVRHHVLLSIVGIDRLEGNAHFDGKRRQEQLLSNSPVPVTIQRATQFHEFAWQVVQWTRQGQVATVPPLLATGKSTATLQTKASFGSWRRYFGSCRWVGRPRSLGLTVTASLPATSGP